MASALDAVLQLRNQEDQRQQQAASMAIQLQQLHQQAQQQAAAQQLAQLQQAQQSKLQDAQIQNYQSDAAKNTQEMLSKKSQQDMINKLINGNSSTGTPGWGVKSIKVGDVTLEKPPEPINGGIPLTDINSVQDPNMKALVHGVLDYKIDPSKSTSLRSDQRQKLVEMATAIDPTYDQTQFPARSKFRNNLTSGTLSKGIVSANTIIGHLGALKDSFDELNKARPLNNIPLVNTVENAFLTGSGKSAAITAKLNADAVANEMETLFRGTGGSGSLTGVQEFKKNFSLASSPEQQQAIIKKAIDLVASRVNAVDDLNNTVMGKPRNFSVLSDKSKKIIEGLGVDPSQVDSFGVQQNDSNSGWTPEKEARLQELRNKAGKK